MQFLDSCFCARSAYNLISRLLISDQSNRESRLPQLDRPGWGWGGSLGTKRLRALRRYAVRMAASVTPAEAATPGFSKERHPGGRPFWSQSRGCSPALLGV